MIWREVTLKMDGWNTRFLLGWPIFRGYMLVPGSVLCRFFRGLIGLVRAVDSCMPRMALEKNTIPIIRDYFLLLQGEFQGAYKGLKII